MKDLTENELREERPQISAKEAVKFCLKQIFQDKEHTLGQSVAFGLIYEEVIGALLLAEDILDKIDTCPNAISKEQLYYITQLYPESVTTDEAKAEYAARVEKKEIDDSWWEASAKIVNDLTSYAEPILEADIMEVDEADYTIIPAVDSCPNCGGGLIGDGYTMVRHCENVSAPLDVEPDAGPIYCDEN